MAKEGWPKRIWHLVTPVLIYLGITYLVELFAGLYWGLQMIDDTGTVLDTEALFNVMTKNLLKYAMLLQTIAASFTIIILVRMYLKDYTKRRFVFDKNSVPKIEWIWLIPTAIFASMAGNLLLNVSDLANESEGFQQAQELLFSGPIIFQIIGIGVIIPICEELIYRGLIYMRMRQYLEINMAIVVSALLFGMFHANVVQGIYAFLLGVLLTYVYEQYGSLKAPIIVHILANVTSLSLSLIGFSMDNKVSVLFNGIFSVALCLGAVFIIEKRVCAKKIYIARLQARGGSKSDNHHEKS